MDVDGDMHRDLYCDETDALRAKQPLALFIRHGAFKIRKPGLGGTFWLAE
jgi:hypothetical protein